MAPNFTPAAPVVPLKFVPVMTTLLPPAVGPEVGETAVTEGEGRLTVIVNDVSVNADTNPHVLPVLQALAYQTVIVSVPPPDRELIRMSYSSVCELFAPLSTGTSV